MAFHPPHLDFEWADMGVDGPFRMTLNEGVPLKQPLTLTVDSKALEAYIRHWKGVATWAATLDVTTDLVNATVEYVPREDVDLATPSDKLCCYWTGDAQCEADVLDDQERGTGRTTFAFHNLVFKVNPAHAHERIPGVGNAVRLRITVTLRRVPHGITDPRYAHNMTSAVRWVDVLPAKQ